jgi:hypothetical protein
LHPGPHPDQPGPGADQPAGLPGRWGAIRPRPAGWSAADGPGLGVDGVVGDRAAAMALVARGGPCGPRCRHRPARSANQPPAVGGLEHHLDRLGLELADDAPELDWALPIRRDSTTSPAGSRATTCERLRCSPPRPTPCQGLGPVACPRRTLPHALSTGAEAHSLMTSRRRGHWAWSSSSRTAARSISRVSPRAWTSSLIACGPWLGRPTWPRSRRS